MKYLIALILSAHFSTVSAQKTPEQIAIDFQSKSITLPPKENLRKNKDIQIKVKNLPTNTYKVSINKNDSIFNVGNPPPLFSALNFGSSFNSLLSSLAPNSVQSVVSVKKSVTPPTGTETFMFNDETKLISPKTKTLIVDPCYSSEALPLFNHIKKARLDIFNFHYSFRDEVVKMADELLYEVSAGSLTDAAKFQTRAQAIVSKKLDKDKELESIFVKYYDETLIINNYEVLANCAALKTADSMLSAYKRNFNLFLSNFDSLFNTKLIANTYKQLNTPKPPNEFLSLPFHAKSDITKFTIDITGIDPTKPIQNYNTTIELEKYPNRMWAFTTGIFASGLSNDNYSILTNTQQNASNINKLDTTGYTIISEGSQKVSAGINALLHVGSYFNSSSEVGAFLAFGPGLTFEKNPQLRIMGGAGLVFGRTNKVALTFGWTGGPVKRLASSYNTTNVYNPAPQEITRDLFKGSWFASIGYSLFGK